MTTLLKMMMIFFDNCYSTRQCGKFNYKYFRTTLKYICISVYGVKLWNGLSGELSSIASICKFKMMLKTSLLNRLNTKVKLSLVIST